jgi:hypothetical protein
LISVSDILKILDQIPIWKKVSALPARIEALEKRVAELERAKPPATGICPLCQSPVRVEKEVDDPIFGPLGGKRHHLRCTNPSCDYTGTRSIKG